MEEMNKKPELKSNQIMINDKIVSYIPTPTGYYLDMQTKAQGTGGKIMIRRYVEEILKRVEENYKVDDFTPNEIDQLIEGFDNFCNAKGN